MFVNNKICAYLRAVPDGAIGRLGACSQSRTYCEQTIARQRGMSMERKRNANEHRENFYSLLNERCRMEQLGGWELAHIAAHAANRR